MLVNLNRLLRDAGIADDEVGRVLGITGDFVRRCIDEEDEFLWEEMLVIRERFFGTRSLDYLTVSDRER